MGSVCQKQEYESPFKSEIAQIGSVINKNPKAKQSEMLELLSLTSENSFSCAEQLSICDSKGADFRKCISDFRPIRLVGKGSFGEVFLVQDKLNSRSYAMKVINKANIKNKYQKTNALSERYLLQALDNPFIVKLHYAFQSKNKLYLLVDFMAGGELFYLLRSHKKFPQPVAKFYAAQILLALEYLHSRNIIYRDLKPENILLSKSGHAKLADFGLSKICFNRNQLAFSICGTPEYIAPEIIQGRGYDQSADWFSFGSVLYDMLTGRPPFFCKNKHEILKNIASKEVPIPDNLSKEAQSLLRALFRIKPSQRLGYKEGANQVKAHQFFAGVDFQQLAAYQVEPPFGFQNCQINVQGFEKELIAKQPVEQMKLSQSEVNGSGFYPDFEYFKPESSICKSFEMKDRGEPN